MTLNLTGMRFGKLSVIERQDAEVIGSGNNKRKVSISWSCVCDCGNYKKVIASQLSGGHVKSCGCLRRQHPGPKTAHGETGSSKEYVAWRAMKSRCYYTKCRQYKYYGGRGVSVCDRWINSYENFLFDMGRAPSPSHSLDRYPNNSGNYEPGNCRWATIDQQNNNRRRSILLECGGITLSVSQWSKRLNITRRVLDRKLKNGNSIELIVNEILGQNKITL